MDEPLGEPPGESREHNQWMATGKIKQQTNDLKSMKIRFENKNDVSQIRNINETSFPSASEADLVDRLRADGDAVYSLVAVVDGALVGHVMFSKMAAPFRALGLAPVAVLPEHRGRGIAAALIEAGKGLARTDGWQGIFVLGDTAYYQRFGFDTDLARGFESPYAGEHFMALSLVGLRLPRSDGKVDYAPAFSA
ncbi:MAG: N-acetyltransferase [Gammaproteobacteria bacterium]|nr:N-acetyltransferase [Gammaproteobacteria bacterium]